MGLRPVTVTAPGDHIFDQGRDHLIGQLPVGHVREQHPAAVRRLIGRRQYPQGDVVARPERDQAAGQPDDRFHHPGGQQRRPGPLGGRIGPQITGQHASRAKYDRGPAGRELQRDLVQAVDHPCRRTRLARQVRDLGDDHIRVGPVIWGLRAGRQLQVRPGHPVHGHPPAGQPGQVPVGVGGLEDQLVVGPHGVGHGGQQIAWSRHWVADGDGAFAGTFAGARQFRDQPGQARRDHARIQPADPEPLSCAHDPLESLPASPGCLDQFVHGFRELLSVGGQQGQLGTEVRVMGVQPRRATSQGVPQVAVRHACRLTILIPQADECGQQRDQVGCGQPGAQAGQRVQAEIRLDPAFGIPAGPDQPLGHLARVEQRAQRVPGGWCREVRVAAAPGRYHRPLHPGQLGDLGHGHQ